MTMNHLFPPLLPKDDLRDPVLVLAAHPDDDVMGCGGMLAWHVQRGDRVTVAHLTDGAAGDPAGRDGDIRATRLREGREALARLGVTDLRSFDLPDGALPEHADELFDVVQGLFEEIEPRTLYGYHFTEAHRDHRAVAHAIADAWSALPAECRVLLYGINHAVAGGTMFDIGPFVEVKQRALQAYASQLAYNDFATRIKERDHAATINVEDPAIEYAEVFADLRPDELEEARELGDALIRFLLRDDA